MNTQGLARYLEQCQVHLGGLQTCQLTGRLTRINGLVMEASGLKLPLGASARIQLPGEGMVEAEVVGFAGDRLFMMPAEDVYGLAPGALVYPQEPKSPPPVLGQPRPIRRRAADRTKHLPVGDELLGRVVDGSGKPLIVRGCWDKITPSSCRWYQATSKDDGKSWEESWVMDWQRRAG